MNKKAILVICALFVCGCIAVNAQSSFYYNGNGTSAGRSQTMGNTTYHYNANGTSAGRSQINGNTTYHYNGNGTSAGRTQRNW